MLEHSPYKGLPQDWLNTPSEDLRTFINDGDYYAFARGIYEKENGDIIPSINRTHKHRVERIEKTGVQMSMVMWGRIH